MKKLLIVCTAVLSSVVANAQTEIKMEDLNKHVGDSVTVCTKIFGGVYLERSKGTPTLLNAGGNYPDSPLTIVIWPETRAKFKGAPEELFKEKNVCVTGKIVLYKEKTQIVVYDEKQIVVKE